MTRNLNLKYRRGGSAIGYSVEVFDVDGVDEGLDFEKPEKMPREWISNEDLFIWPLFSGPIEQNLLVEIETISQKEDKMNRKQLGFPPLEEDE